MTYQEIMDTCKELAAFLAYIEKAEIQIKKESKNNFQNLKV